MTPNNDEPQYEQRAVSNTAVGRAIGLSPSAVSRIRTATRYPSIRGIKRIAAVYDWPVEQQLKLIPLEPGTYDARYAQELEKKIQARNS